MLAVELKNIAYSLRLEILPLVEQKKYQELDVLMKKLGKDIKTRITVIAPKGDVLADSEKDPKLMENHKGRPEVGNALKGETGKSLRFSTTVKEEMLYVAVPLKLNHKLIGVLRTSLFLKEINKLLNNLRVKILQITAFIFLFSLLGAWFFSKNFSAPIKSLVNASKKIANGDFTAKVSLRRRDELGRLSESFNEMGQELKELFKDLNLRKEELNGIISSLQEGLLVLDKKGRIFLFNESFRKIARIDEIKGRFYWEVLRGSQVGGLIEKARKEKKNFLEEIGLNDKVFLCSTVFIPSKEELIIVLHDITEFKKLEKIKKDFVVNVSHELRTPLTAMKGYIETLEDEVKEEEAKHYLDIVKKHTERLINIVSDLLTLSKLEEEGLSLGWKEVNLNNLVENVFKIFKKTAEDKNLKLNLYCEKEPITVKADSFKLEQMFINLIDNAIKYTEKGEVSVSLKEENKNIKVEVKDTGIGIPQDALGRIFERFYVVDKSRSRKLGGTGLGLSIVKHIVLLHNGKINVESTPGEGTKFIIRFPTNPS